MQILIEQAALARVMSRVASVVPRRSTIPILSNVLIDASGEGVTLSGTDLDMEIRERVEAVIERPGRITVGAASLSEIARNAPAGAEIAIIGPSGDDPRAQVRFGRARYQLPALPADDFPTRADLKGATTLAFPAADLLGLLDHIHFAQSTEETHYYLNGAYFHAVSDAGRPMFRVVATDGVRLVIDQLPLAEGVGVEGVIVPRAAVLEFRRLLAGAKGDAQLSMCPTGVSLEIGETRLITKTIDGTYPDYVRPTPQNWEREIVIDRLALHAAIKRVALISAEKSRSVKLEIEDEVLTLTVRNMEAGAAAEDLEVTGHGPTFSTGFNSKFLLDVLEQTEADQMLFRINGGTDAARLDPHPATPGCAHIINVVMPVRM